MNAETLSPTPPRRCETGVPGLDSVLAGGLPEKRLFLVRGSPGTGKTTLALQFLLRGRAIEDPCLYITLSETKEELELVAASHGWSLEGMSLIELSSIEQQLKPESQTTLLHPSEVELTRTMKLLEGEVERLKPRRVVFDSLAELRLLAQNPLRYRRQILSLKTFFATRDCTVLLLDDKSEEAGDQQVESIAHGVIELDHIRPEYGSARRRLSVMKLRGVKFRGGYHDYVIQTGGLEVFPRLIAAEHHAEFPRESIGCGVPELDRLIDGGLDRGTSTLFSGPPAAANRRWRSNLPQPQPRRGEQAALFAFDENIGTILARSNGLGMNIKPLMDAGKLRIQQVDPAELAPGEFAAIVRRLVESDGAKVIVIDSMNGYLNAMPDERFLVTQLHELLTCLSQRGVSTILVLAQHGLMGSMQSPVDLTYMADTVLLFRFFEFAGAIKKAVSVIKKRSGDHEETIREFGLVKGAGVKVGEPLKQFRGVLTGTPTYTGDGKSILFDGGKE